MSLLYTFEQIDPGHFAKRHKTLQSVSNELKELGFFPLQISEKDIECYWVRLETIYKNKHINVTVETFDDISAFPELLESLKKVAKYETR
jgi:hypothetical protein